MRLYLDADGVVIDYRMAGSSIYNDPTPDSVRVLEVDESTNQRLVGLLASSSDVREFRVTDAGIDWNGVTLPVVSDSPLTVYARSLQGALAALAQVPAGGQVKGTEMLLVVYELARRAGILPTM